MKVPNAETIEALRQARSREGLTEYADLEYLKVWTPISVAMYYFWLLGRVPSIESDIDTVFAKTPSKRADPLFVNLIVP